MTPIARAYAVIPAAGRSHRMGEPKLLLPWGDRTLLEHTLAAWMASEVTSVVLVAHPQDLAIHDLARRSGADVVAPTDPPDDMQQSLAVGLGSIAKRLAPQPEDVWLTAPADMPFLSAELIDALLDAARQCDAPIVAPRVAGRRGHPVLLRWPLAEELRQLAPGSGLHALTRRHEVREIDWPDARILEDLDTPEDYRLRIAQASRSLEPGA